MGLGQYLSKLSPVITLWICLEVVWWRTILVSQNVTTVRKLEYTVKVNCRDDTVRKHSMHIQLSISIYVD